LKTNLENRLAIVEELKELLILKNIKDTLKHFNDLRERWKNAGPIVEYHFM
jgi:DNA mismatch repair ATPase MutS